MHILLIPSWYATPRNPIRGSFFLDQAVALTHAGHQVGMLVPPSRLRTLHGLREVGSFWHKSPSDISVTMDAGIKIYRMPWWGWVGSVNIARRVELALQVFERYCEEQGTPDILHGHSILYGGYLATKIGQVHQIPSIITEHHTRYLANQLQWGEAKATTHIMERTNKILAVAPGLAQTMMRFVNRPVDVVGNVVDTNFYTPQPDNIPLSPFVFTVVGTLSKRKAQDVLLQAFALTFQQQPVELHIAGTGVKRRNYQQLAKKLGIASQVHFHGALSRTAVRDLLQKSHVLVSSSYIETFGVTIIEAMACGKPILATRSGGPEYFVDEKSGVLVPVGDIDALAEGLKRIKENYSAYNPHEIRQIVVNRFSENAIAQALTTHYKSLLS
jgi:L-malate glycosyltransferase